jgi:hypothetical protein
MAFPLHGIIVSSNNNHRTPTFLRRLFDVRFKINQLHKARHPWLLRFCFHFLPLSTLVSRIQDTKGSGYPNLILSIHAEMPISIA